MLFFDFLYYLIYKFYSGYNEKGAESTSAGIGGFQALNLLTIIMLIVVLNNPKASINRILSVVLFIVFQVYTYIRYIYRENHSVNVIESKWLSKSESFRKKTSFFLLLYGALSVVSCFGFCWKFLMIIRTFKTGIYFCVLLLLSCGFNVTNDHNIVQQIYFTDSIKAYVVHEVGSNNNLSIFKNNKRIYSNDLGYTPCEIYSISHDTITIQQYYLNDQSIKNGNGDSIERKEIGGHMFLKLETINCKGSVNKGLKTIDSIEVKKTTVFLFHNGSTEIVDKNRLLYNGKDFFRTSIRKGNRLFEHYQINDENFVREYDAEGKEL